MSRAGKASFILSLLAFVILLVGRVVYEGWHNTMWFPVALCIGFFILGVVKDYRVLRSFFGMRTTKHGLNMGALILIAIIGLICINYFAARYEKTFDWTSENLNSLSEQSRKAALGLKDPTQILVLYRKDQQEEDVQRAVSTLVAMYTNVTNKVSFAAYNALQRPDLAQKYGYTSGPFAVFAVQGEKKVKIEQPNEEGVTRAFIKLGRDSKKTIYFTKGHGERDLESTGAEGIASLKDELAVTYDVKSITLFESGNKVPADASVVAIVGPNQQFLEPELQALRDYLKSGGHLLIAVDPGTRHNLAQLTKTVGVEFENNYILDLRSQVVQGGPTVVLGNGFSKESDVTKSFPAGEITVFYQASNIKKAPNSGFQLIDVISTDERTMTLPELTEQVKYLPNGPHTLAISSMGKLADGQKDFSAVVFGDSDFMANNLISNNLNRDLISNSFAWLSSDTDLISIRPKTAKGTKLDMTPNGFLGYTLAVLLPIPLLMFLAGGFVWWRRRTA